MLMIKMVEDLISGIVYIKYDFVTDPHKPVFLLSDLPENKISTIKSVTKSLLGDREEQVPETLFITPIPGTDLKCMTKFIQWEEDDEDDDEQPIKVNIRAGILIVYHEAHDLIYYKYKTSFEKISKEYAIKCLKIEVEHSDESLIPGFLQELHDKMLSKLRKLENKETAIDDMKSGDEGYEDQFVEEDEFDFKFKLIVCGDGNVGKTSLVLRFTDNAFKRNYMPTIGVNITEKLIFLKDYNVKLLIWDIAGQSKFNIMRTNFYLGAQGYLLVFDLTNPESFEGVKNWYNDITKHIKTKQIHGYLLGNKNDLEEQRKISYEQGSALAKEWNLDYFETSALTSEKVDESFMELSKEIIEIQEK